MRNRFIKPALAAVSLPERRLESQRFRRRGRVGRPDNVPAAILPAGDYVQVTCWYYGNMPGYAADGYEDHVVWVSTLGNFTGHIPDDYVHLGGTPNNEGISECG